MADWQNFYLQKMGSDGQGNPYDWQESVATWGIFCKEIPFKIMDKVKEPAKRSWYDEHGDDEYIPSEGLYVDSYSMKVEFGCKLITGDDANVYGITVDDVRVNVGNFLEWLRSAGMMKMYSSYTRIGRQNVRLVSINDKAWNSGDGEWLIFEVEFKVCDPVTDVSI
jgi:hypothetical protein